MKNTALITGASGGIGRDLARVHAEQGGDLVIVARRLEELEKLKAELEKEHGTEIVCISADLTEPGVAQRIYDEVKQQGIEIEVLINNAGFGGHGKFYEQPWERQEAMIGLNVTALCAMTHIFLPEMVERKRGKILNVASIAGLVPGPLLAVYFATKAFVVSFSQSIAEELLNSNVTVTALCPGPVDTGFLERAQIDDVPLFTKAVPSMKVAKFGYRAMLKGRLVAISEWRFFFLFNFLVPFAPRRTVLWFSRKAMEKH